MGWRSVIIANPAQLTLKDHALVVEQNDHRARVMLEDISVVLLEHAQVTLTVPLLSALAEHQIAVLTVNAAHLPNGVLLPYAQHSRALRVQRAQLALSRPNQKRVWQRLVHQKVSNQAAVLDICGEATVAKKLWRDASRVRSGDPDNIEAQSARRYFPALFGADFTRSDGRFFNHALNYGYAVCRGAIARSVAAFGFLPAFGVGHRSEQNAFNLADDLLEPFRPLVDLLVARSYSQEPDGGLSVEDKAQLVQILHQDIQLSSDGGRVERCSVLAAMEAVAKSLSRIIVKKLPPETLALPRAEPGAGASRS